MQEIRRTLANPNTPYYHTLMNGLFSQTVEQHQDYTYDAMSYSASGPFTKEAAYCRMRLADLASGVCRRHGVLCEHMRVYMCAGWYRVCM